MSNDAHDRRFDFFEEPAAQTVLGLYQLPDQRRQPRQSLRAVQVPVLTFDGP